MLAKIERAKMVIYTRFDEIGEKLQTCLKIFDERQSLEDIKKLAS